MDNELDIKLNNVIVCATRILIFQRDADKAKTVAEGKDLDFFIEEQKKLISEYTDVPIDDILKSVAQINSLKHAIVLEEDPKMVNLANEMLNTSIDELSLQLSKSHSKASDFRNRDKFAIKAPTMPISGKNEIETDHNLDEH